MHSNSAIESPWPQRKRWHHKSTTGCATCRKRRVKCDEQKPRCKNCMRNNIVCYGEDYGATLIDESEDLVAHQKRVNEGALAGIRNSTEKRQLLRANQQHALLTALTGTKGDPFNVFCVDSSPRQHQKIFDHAAGAQWALFATSEKPSDLAVVKTEVMSHIIHSPVSYYTFLYAGACHRLFWKEGFERSPERTSELLILKNKAIRAMRAAVQTGLDEPTDEVIMAMVLLAAHGSAEQAQRRRLGKVQSRKSLVRTLEAEYWCALDTEGPHMDILAEMVQRRGGVKNIRPGVLLTAMYLFDIFDSHMHLTRPRFDSLMPFSFALSMRMWGCDAIAEQRLKTITDGFCEVFSYMGESTASQDLQQVVRGFMFVELDLDRLNRSTDVPEKDSPHYASVIWIRSMCIREVLLLPDNLSEEDGDTAEESQLAQLTYELCRLSCSLICQVWLFADCSPTRNLARYMVDKLHPLLLRATTGKDSDMLCEKLPDFFLWNFVLGIALAYEDFNETGNVKGMHKLAPFIENAIVKAKPNAWSVISDSLKKFLWPVKEQEETGMEAWRMVCQILDKSG